MSGEEKWESIDKRLPERIVEVFLEGEKSQEAAQGGGIMVLLRAGEQFCCDLQEQRGDLLEEVVVPRGVAQDPFSVDRNVEVGL